MIPSTFQTVIDCDRKAGARECEYKLESRFTLGKQLGSGRYGTVFLLNTYEVIKLIPLGQETCERCSMTTFKDFQQEVEVTKYASIHQICPLFIHSEIILGSASEKDDTMKVEIGIIIQKRYPMTLDDYASQFENAFNEQRTKIIDMVRALITKCVDLGIFHNDLKPDNVVVMLDELAEISELRFIDFGVASLFDPKLLSPEEKQIKFGQMFTKFINVWKYL